MHMFWQDLSQMAFVPCMLSPFADMTQAVIKVHMPKDAPSYDRHPVVSGVD